MSDKFRDPIYGFIEVRPLERKIIDSDPFQRLHNIKQLAWTYLVFHGAEHTRFGHSLGVMHLVSKAFNAAINNSKQFLSNEKKDWLEQILRLIALTHDLGHAPFSHAAEAVFPKGLSHEVFTEKIVKETCIADIIRKIGNEYKEKYGKEFDITPELICDIYAGRNPGDNLEFTFLHTFMDSELDCDKMDYLLRDSLYCGVNYGKFDLERLISSLIIDFQDGGNPRLAINSGGIQAFEEFVLSRYFMFVQVYFHRTRRYLDIMYASALKKILPDGLFPDTVSEYLKWDDCRILQLMKEKSCDVEECSNVINRRIYPRVLHTKTHPEEADNREFLLVRNMIYEKFGRENFLEDHSADKMPHKIPIKTEIGDEKAIVIVDKASGKITTISEESNIIKSLVDKINIKRVYVKPEFKDDVEKYIKGVYGKLRNEYN